MMGFETKSNVESLSVGPESSSDTEPEVTSAGETGDSCVSDLIP